MDVALFPGRMAALSLGVLGMMGGMLSVTGVFGMAAYSVSKRRRELGIRMAVGAQRKEVLQAALGSAFKLLAFGVGGRLAARNPSESSASFHRISGYSSRSAGVSWCCCRYGLSGITGYVDSRATRALD